MKDATVKDRIQNCQSCNAEIIFMITKNNKFIPVDYKEEFLEHSEFNPELGHITHFATCPNAEKQL
jgi:hypothetical protein